ncbi:MAG: hypothetical protein ABSC06_20500 [Rhodopila sp.]
MTVEEEYEERQLRMDQMTVNIEKMRHDMQWESRKFTLQLVAALGTAMAGGAGLLALILHLTGRL